VERQDTLGAGAYEVRARGQLLAVVDMSGDAAVLPSVRPSNFEFAVWKRIERARIAVPDNFSRVSLSELMWRYVSRTSRDVLPPRYLKGPIFFRRAPRVDPVMVEEEHLLVMRELAVRPLAFDELQRALGMADATLSKVLAALYYVGAITSTRARAASTTVAADMRRSQGNSNYGELRTGEMELSDLRQLTAPAPIVLA
jgi:DNA-binding transcriptional ArsR family regulator